MGPEPRGRPPALGEGLGWEMGRGPALSPGAQRTPRGQLPHCRGESGEEPGERLLGPKAGEFRQLGGAGNAQRTETVGAFPAGTLFVFV